jgi:hypothetical protein
MAEKIFKGREAANVSVTSIGKKMDVYEGANGNRTVDLPCQRGRKKCKK